MEDQKPTAICSNCRRPIPAGYDTKCLRCLDSDALKGALSELANVGSIKRTTAKAVLRVIVEYV